MEKDKCCLVCVSTKKLEGHHLFSTKNLELKADHDNGVILCRECHRGKEGFHTKYGKNHQFTPSDFIEFMEKSKHAIKDEEI
ncbi:HNH endonuclease [Bacillus sp. JJ1474]|uniref:HNH endonuclease n=1 Tax=Bacillus sp. JJ1474 TaxID=3122955 RepID=UPI002FFE9E19